jgi:MFS family permease
MSSDAIPAVLPRAGPDIARVLGQTFTSIGHHWRTLLILVVPLAVIPALLSGLLMNGLVTVAGQLKPVATSNPTQILQSVGWLLVVYLPLGLILQPLFESSASWTVWAGEAGEQPNVSTALRAAGRQLGWVILASFLRGLLIMLGWIILIVPGIMVWLAFCLTLPACVAEKRNAIEAMNRSRDLTRGHRWSLFLLFVVLVVVAAIPSFVATAVGTLAAFAAPGVGVIIRAGLNAVVGGFSATLIAAGIGCAYVELRTLKEGGGAKVAEVFA